MMFSVGQRCCSTMLEKENINVGCTKNRSTTLQVAFHLHCMGSDVEDMIHWLTIRSGGDEDVLENALSILADLSL